MSDWLNGICELNRRGEPAALVTIVATRGSTPREPGAKMTVGGEMIHDTIGGGQLEHAAIESARLLLEQGGGAYANQVERHELSPVLGQCCGGVAWLLIERIPPGANDWLDGLVKARDARAPAYLVTAIGGAEKYVLASPGAAAGDALPAEIRELVERAVESGKPVCERDGAGWFVDPMPPLDFHIALFGAGHVGTALAGILAALPCSLTWVDSRRNQLPGAQPANVRTATVRRPETLVHECPPATFYLVMTHSHPLDFAICESILARGDFAYCGLIGSLSKRRSFEKQMRPKGVTESTLNRLTCPIGVAGISGKRPAEIAVAVAAEILQVKGSIPAGRTTDVSKAG